MGKGFWVIAWVLALVLLTFFFDDHLGKRRNPNQSLQVNESNEFTEVVLKRNAQQAYVVVGTIEQNPVTFLVDTGASSVAVPGKIADAAGLKRGYPLTVVTANGTATAYYTMIKSLSIGNIRLENVKAAITPSMTEPTVLLGMSALKQLELIQRNNELTLRQYR